MVSCEENFWSCQAVSRDLKFIISRFLRNYARRHLPLRILSSEIRKEIRDGNKRCKRCDICILRKYREHIGSWAIYSKSSNLFLVWNEQRFKRGKGDTAIGNAASCNSTDVTVSKSSLKGKNLYLLPRVSWLGYPKLSLLISIHRTWQRDTVRYISFNFSYSNVAMKISQNYYQDYLEKKKTYFLYSKERSRCIKISLNSLWMGDFIWIYPL